MKHFKTKVLLVVAGIVLVLAWSSFFVVEETEQAIITQFGKPVGNPLSEPGIHVKVPFIQKANLFDRRFLEWDGDRNQIPTKDKRFIWVDTYARWRISDPLLFFQRVRDERGAQSRLDDILDGETRDVLASHNLVEIIRTSNRKPQADSELDVDPEDDEFIAVRFGRQKLTRMILKSSAPRTLELGIELLDLQLKRINYVSEVQEKIYDRMISERLRIAEKYRSEGQGRASKIAGEKEREHKRIQSEAYKIAQEIIGKGDAEAASIYAKAYNKNAESRELYRFLKTMESYRDVFSSEDLFFLSTEGDYFGYFHKQKGP